MSRALLLGEAPARGRNRVALDGRAGDRLAGYLGTTREGLLEAFETANLLGRWPGGAGKGSAWPLAASRRAARRKPLTGVVVLLGGRVAAAYGLADLGRHQWLRTRRALVAAIAHPSGVNRLYNDPAERQLAARTLAEAAALAAGGMLAVVPDPRRGDLAVNQNERRANVAMSAVIAFTDQNYRTDGEHGLETDVSDLIADLHHLADRHGLRWDAVLDGARRAYEGDAEDGPPPAREPVPEGAGT